MESLARRTHSALSIRQQRRKMSIGYCLGEWTVRPHRNRIERGSESVHLAPKTMAVLDCLAKASNSVVTRQEIFDSVWPGAAVSDDVLTQRIAELRKAFGDSAHQPKVIETIPKTGFRLILPVIPLSEESETQKLHRAAGPKQALKWLAYVVVGLLLAALSLRLFWPVSPAIQEPSTDMEDPVIAVLPFVNMSKDPGNEYFSDGISEELINLLAKVPDLHVISRSSSFSFKGEPLKIADVARELNASLIVEGTVRKVNDQVRITAQLIDPATDKHLWSDSFDRELADIFSLQGEIAQSILTALRDEIGPHTVIGSRPTKSIEAYELFLQGRQKFYQRGATMDSAIMVLQMAVEVDPDFAEAWAFLAAAASVTWAYQTSISNEEARPIAEHASKKAHELNPRLGLALAAQAILAFGYEGNLEKAFHLIDRAADEDPHDSTIRLWAGIYYYYWGYLEEALPHFLYAVGHDPRVGIINGCLGLLYLAKGQEDLANQHLAKATKLGWSNHFSTQASQRMMRGDFGAAFALLKVTFAISGTNRDPLPWIYELEEAGRSYIENPMSMEELISVIERVPKRVAFAASYLTLLFNLKDTFFDYFARSVNESHLWPSFVMPIVWLPEYRAYVEDPRFFEIMSDDGALGLWEQRGFPDGCIRVDDPSGDRLDCSKRYGD
jgi:TolB-like protein/DNA-binding winged helix-turn-helix (wHTH) protein/Tfp pilus assembly protein PilF